jgi:hypothetical protein
MLKFAILTQRSLLLLDVCSLFLSLRLLPRVLVLRGFLGFDGMLLVLVPVVNIGGRKCSRFDNEQVRGVFSPLHCS